MLPFAREKLAWFEENNVKLLKWPAQSPDLNPIEHLWQQLDRRLGSRHFSNKADLFKTLKKEWHSIPLKNLIKLVDSMPERCREVIKANGLFTKY